MLSVVPAEGSVFSEFSVSSVFSVSGSAVPDDSPTWKIENRLEIIVSGSRVSPISDPDLPDLFESSPVLLGFDPTGLQT